MTDETLRVDGDLVDAPIQSAGKTMEEYFRDWEGSVFGFGYGTGEEHTLAALKTFFESLGVDGRANSYEYETLERALTPTVAWLMINVLCHADVIEYGTSPRYGWLTRKGERLRVFSDARSVDDLVDICCNHDETYTHCYPDACNCGPNGYEKGRKCANPFWRDK